LSSIGFTVPESQGERVKLDQVHPALGRHLDRALVTLQAAPGRPLTELWQATSRNAARAIGADATKGSLEPGKDADLVLLDPELRVIATVAEGALVHGGEQLLRRPTSTRSATHSGRAPPG